MTAAALASNAADNPAPHPVPDEHIAQADPSLLNADGSFLLDDGSKVLLPAETAAVQTDVKVDHAANIARTMFGTSNIEQLSPLELKGDSDFGHDQISWLAGNGLGPVPAPELEPPAERDLPKPEVHQVTPEVEKVMDENALYVGTLGCSGFTIRDEKNHNQSIGIVSAGHCLTLPGQDGRFKGLDGNQYLPNAPELLPSLGSRSNRLKPIGRVDRVTAPLGVPNITQGDMYLGALEGHSIPEVMRNFRHMSEAQLRQLEPGKSVAYSSGWPVYQPNSPNGVMERQNFAMTFLGMDEDTGFIWFAVPKNPDSTECSPGNSGSMLFVMNPERAKDGRSRNVPVALGVASVYIDFTGGPRPQYDDTQAAALSARQAAEARFNYNLEDMSAICGYAWPVPKLGQDAEELRLVATPEEIPGYEALYSYQASERRVRQEFLNPAKIKHYVDGYIAIGGGVNQDGQYTELRADRPLVTYDPIGRRYAMGYYDPAAPDHLRVIAHDYSPSMTIIDRDSTPGVKVFNFTGPLRPGREYQISPDGSHIGAVRGFVDPPYPDEDDMFTVERDAKRGFYTQPIAQYGGVG